MATIDHEPTIGMQKRTIFGVLTPMITAVGFIIAGLANLTVRDHQKYAEMANNTHFTNKTITAGRGAIYDANGTPLAWSATVYKVYIDPSLFRSEMDTIEEKMKARQARVDAGEVLDPDVLIIRRDELEAQIVSFLSEKLKISEDIILTAMDKDTQYYELQKQVEKSVADELTAYFDKLGMDSITTDEDTKRYYPQNELAAQVIGFTNSDGDGQYGLEKAYDDYLSGVNGRVTSAKDAQGNAMPYRYSTTYEAQDGDSLYLTLDSTLQYILEKNLQQMCKDYNVQKRACGIIMNVNDGSIYAMATYPSFDLNNPSVIYDEATNQRLLALPEDEYKEAY
ncbi:MAG: peptidoglycan glycosyltransferase, partial [Oscillospiraceae bacterium]|nr:peptidoglycan glycosyltransferase [Oscillospiraceae bacterium]